MRRALLQLVTVWITSTDVWNKDIQEITFKAGDNVTLECISNDAVESCEWRKSGKERNECLLQWRGASAWECNRDPSLRGRVVRSERRTDRSASVVLKTTDARDAGTYECEAASEGSRPELICIFELKFEEPSSVETWTTETPLHPKILQTPGPNDESAVKGGGNNTGPDHVIIWSAGDVLIIAVLAGAGAVVIAVLTIEIRSCWKSTRGNDARLKEPHNPNAGEEGTVLKVIGDQNPP